MQTIQTETKDAYPGMSILEYLFDVKLYSWEAHDCYVTGVLNSEFSGLPAGTHVCFEKFTKFPEHSIGMIYASAADWQAYETKQEEEDWENDDGWWNEPFTRKKLVKINLMTTDI